MDEDVRWLVYGKPELVNDKWRVRVKANTNDGRLLDERFFDDEEAARHWIKTRVLAAASGVMSS